MAMTRLFLSFAAALCMGLGLLAVPSQAAPNLVFILADDLGYGDLAHSGGLAATPHCDRLAREGMRFTDAHTTSSVCTPTRYGILTGRYNWRSSLKKGVLYGLGEPIISPERVTVPGFLGRQGYHSAVIGKWHLGLTWSKLPNGETRQAIRGKTQGEGWDIDYSRPVAGGPLALGFDHSFIIPASLDMFPYVYLQDDKPTAPATVTKAFHRPGPSTEDFEAVNCLRDFAREARQYIRDRSRDPKTPFFLYLPLTSPHTPIVPSPAWKGKSTLGDYGDFLMETDWVVGEVLAELDARGLTDNTLVLFTTDNGCSPAAKIPDLEAKGHHPNGDWRGHKADIYEGGHRIPFLVRWPGKVKPGSQYEGTVCTADFYATVADLLGKKDALAPDAAEDSFSFLPALLDQPDPENRRPFTIHHSINGSFAIRQGDWKLCLCPGSGGWSAPRPATALKDKSLPPVQLFHLTRDPGEQENLASSETEIVAEMAGLLARAIREGSTRPGAQSRNEGAPNTFPAAVLEAYPILKDLK